MLMVLIKNTNKGNESSKANPGIYYQVIVNSQKSFKYFPYEYGITNRLALRNQIF